MVFIQGTPVDENGNPIQPTPPTTAPGAPVGEPMASPPPVQGDSGQPAPATPAQPASAAAFDQLRAGLNAIVDELEKHFGDEIGAHLRSFLGG